jgi:hypothetical protein
MIRALEIRLARAVLDDGGDACFADVFVELEGIRGAVAAALDVPALGAALFVLAVAAALADGGAAEEGVEEGAERGDGRGGDADAALDRGPDGDVGGGVEEVVDVVEGVEVGETNDGCAGCTLGC